LTFETYYNYLYSAGLLGIQIYKGIGGIDKNAGSHLKYPPNVWGFEIACVIFFFIFQLFRLDHGLRANRNENKNGMNAMLAFTVISIILYMYFMRFTTYVLVIEVIFGVLGIAFPVMELFFSIFTVKTLGSSEKTDY